MQSHQKAQLGQAQLQVGPMHVGNIRFLARWPSPSGQAGKKSQGERESGRGLEGEGRGKEEGREEKGEERRELRREREREEVMEGRREKEGEGRREEGGGRGAEREREGEKQQNGSYTLT